ncbi:hypothetical protein [Hymenobacter metallilatus]|uniref:Uncharacterized protein n=1 Tax=Hymenobacter metallilatus TaxID=2493666 RepID=A0A3R9N3N9_9BACT|nr:hypothetical protein [Hymenobacter metallilatus]RSK24191.1 hypothetical protein EI290_20640 [Hymenobacter metallilatus]
MATIPKKLQHIFFNAPDLPLASAPFRSNLVKIYRINDAGSGWQAYAPGSPFNAVSVLKAGNFYLVESSSVGYDIPGAVLSLIALPPLEVQASFPSIIHGSIILGDSMTTGLNVDTTGISWIQRLCSTLGLTVNNAYNSQNFVVAPGTTFYSTLQVNNLASSGSGVRKQAALAMTNYPANVFAPLECQMGYNNLRISQEDDPTRRYAMINAAHRAVLAIHFSKNIVFAEHISGTPLATYSHGYVGFPSEAVMSDWGSRALWYRRNDMSRAAANCFWKQSVTAGETLTFSINGDRIAIGTWGCDGSVVNMSRIEVRVDGQLKTTYDPTGRAVISSIPVSNDQYTQAGIINDAIVLHGLGTGSHSVELRFLDEGKIGAWDYAVTLKSPIEAAAIAAFIHDIPLASNAPGIGYNYPGYPTYGPYLTAGTESRKTALQAAFPGYPLAFVAVNDAFKAETVAADTQSDGIHPSNSGASKIAAKANGYMVPNTYQSYAQAAMSYTPTGARIASVSPGVYAPIVNNGVPGTYGNPGLFNQKLPAGTDGWFGFKNPAGDAFDAVLGVKTTNVEGGFGTFLLGVWNASISEETPNKTIAKRDNGTNTVVLGALVTLNSFLRVRRYESTTTGKFVLEQSADNGATWQKVYDFVTTYTGDLFLAVDIDGGGKLYLPQGAGFVPVI